jgi:tetratricopeptide (TPR) repeat protein
MPGPRSIRVSAIGIALAVVTVAALSPVTSNLFLNYDDDLYVTGNDHVTAGLTAPGLVWALTTFEAANWHPLTWISHMADVELHGLAPSGHHATSLILHVANVLLLFLLLVRLTGALGPAALASALFAVHPLHVESVAWIAERKDVLSTLFWLLTTLAWLRFLEARTPARYAVVVAACAGGLAAKPMLVTLPFTLMLLDVWPLARATWPPLWKEKLPLIGMAAAACVVTFAAQHGGGAVQSLQGLAFPARLANAAASYAWYLGKIVWPAGLACFCPLPKTIPWAQAAAGTLFVAGATWGAIRVAGRAPYATFGWLWFAGTLVPVIGLVQVGAQAHADRYTYVPSIGLFVAASWGLADLSARRPRLLPAAAVAGAAAVALLVPIARADVRHWHDNVSLFTRAIAVTADNPVAQNNLGLALHVEGKTDDAIAHLREALRIKPDYVDAHINLGAALHAKGRDEEAAATIREALALDPGSVAALVNYGNALAGTGHPDDAIAQYRRALAILPGYADALRNLGVQLEAMGRHAEAIPALTEAVARKPADAALRVQLGNALSGTGHYAEAIAQFEAAARANAESAEAWNGWGIALAALGRPAEAIERYDRAIGVKPGYAEALDNRGLALAATGKLTEAIDSFEAALRVRPDFADAHNNLGVALAQTGRLPEAVEHLRAAVRIDPSSTRAQENLSRVTARRQ